MSGCDALGGFISVLCKLQELLNFVLPVLVALGVVYLVWGVVQYFIGDSEEAKKKGRDGIIFGIIGLTVIISIWGLVYLLVETFISPEYGYAPGSDDIKGLLPKLPQ